MSALHPNAQVTGALVPLTVPVRPARAARAPRATSVWDGPPHRAAAVGAALVALACGLFAVALAVRGDTWAALPMAVLTIGILVGAFLPAMLAARWDAGE